MPLLPLTLPAPSVTWDVPLDYSALGRMTQIEALVGGGAGGRDRCLVHYRDQGGPVARSMELGLTAHSRGASLGAQLEALVTIAAPQNLL